MLPLGETMSLVVMHLRWNDVGPEQYEQNCRALPDGGARPAGCLSRRRGRHGSAVLATDVWRGEQEANSFLARLAAELPPAAVGEPQMAIFTIPEIFATGYGPSSVRTSSPVREAAAAPGTAVVPDPRRPAVALSAEAAGSSR